MAFSLLIAALLPLVGCDKAPNLRGRIAGLHDVADSAEKNGAMRCAPRELALTRAYTQFAEIELRKGALARAEDFVQRAELNAKATKLQSPPEYCTDAPRPKAIAKPGDRDGDGYLAPQDECPDEPEIFRGFEDLDGCPDDPDTDGDGLRDSVDPCPIRAEDIDQYLDSDGCPDVDNDYDGVPDTTDKCPMEPEDPDGYEDADGCPDNDNDGDTVEDIKDRCPNSPGQTEKDPLGCTIKPQLVVVTDCEVKITQQIHFAYNTDVVKVESYPILDAVLEVLQKNESIKLEIQGHTDSRGSDEYNKQLSDRRAASVRKYLVSRGIPPTRLESKGYGEERPIVDNDTDENRALNRRVQFIRTEGQKSGCGPQATEQ
jgi:outer membrane protein OmpA-like peptidoglycan-associated protein